MDYKQKYLKYKAKYIALQRGGTHAHFAVAGLTEPNIPSYLKNLDDVFLPGFNIDKEYVEALLAGAFIATDSNSLINFLIQLNNVSENGLNAHGNRNTKTQKKNTKKDIDTKLKEMVNIQNDKRDAALNTIKIIKKIRDMEKGPELDKFQTIDNAFLPGFNVDKAYVGAVYSYAKDATSAKDLINKLIILNNATKSGLNAIGDRMTETQTQKTKKDIDTKLKANLKSPILQQQLEGILKTYKEKL